MEDNPFRCDCGLVWLSQWLRRWLRETVKVQRFEPATALQLHHIARQSTCLLPNGRYVLIIIIIISAPYPTHPHTPERRIASLIRPVLPQGRSRSQDRDVPTFAIVVDVIYFE